MCCLFSASPHLSSQSSPHPGIGFQVATPLCFNSCNSSFFLTSVELPVSSNTSHSQCEGSSSVSNLISVSIDGFSQSSIANLALGSSDQMSVFSAVDNPSCPSSSFSGVDMGHAPSVSSNLVDSSIFLRFVEPLVSSYPFYLPSEPSSLMSPIASVVSDLAVQSIVMSLALSQFSVALKPTFNSSLPLEFVSNGSVNDFSSFSKVFSSDASSHLFFQLSSQYTHSFSVGPPVSNNFCNFSVLSLSSEPALSNSCNLSVGAPLLAFNSPSVVTDFFSQRSVVTTAFGIAFSVSVWIGSVNLPKSVGFVRSASFHSPSQACPDFSHRISETAHFLVKSPNSTTFSV